MSEGSGEDSPKPSPRESGLGRIRRAYEIELRRNYDIFPPYVYEDLVQGDSRLRDALAHAVGDVLEQHVPTQPQGTPARILDLAAGTGLLSRDLTARGYVVTAVDLSQRMLDHLKTQDPSIHTLVADMNTPLPLEDESFEGVTELKGNRYIRNTPRFLAEIRRVLTPGGTFVWPIFPIDGPVWKVLSGIRQPITSGSLARQAKDVGFSYTEVIRSPEISPKISERRTPSYVIARK